MAFLSLSNMALFLTGLLCFLYNLNEFQGLSLVKLGLHRILMNIKSNTFN